jgi:hypothetical protein
MRNVEIRKSTLGETHPLTLSSLKHLAVLYNNQGSYNKQYRCINSAWMYLRPVLGKISQRY